MWTLVLVVIGGAALLCAYGTYGRYLSRRVFELDDDRPTPAHTERDGTDYVPTKKSVIFGHHFTSIAGTGPIVGPAIAVMWGWLPAIIWVILGSIFVGAVHDLGSLVVSLRRGGRSIGDIAGDLLGSRARVIFLLILIVGLWIVLAIFGLVIAAVLKQYPAAITPVLLQVPLAIVIGLMIHRKGRSIVVPSVIALVLMYASVVWGDVGVLHDVNRTLAAQPIWAWTVGLLIYCYIASVLPVWVLLQPRDYINALQLVSCLGLIVVGLVFAAVLGGPMPGPEYGDAGGRGTLELVAPMVDWQPIGAPPMFPVLFITIACGACSGFHCLVSSGTTSKQVAKESDAKAVGYGSMLTEGFLATLVIAACAGGIGLGTGFRPETLKTLTDPTRQTPTDLKAIYTVMEIPRHGGAPYQVVSTWTERLPVLFEGRKVVPIDGRTLHVTNPAGGKLDGGEWRGGSLTPRWVETAKGEQTHPPVLLLSESLGEPVSASLPEGELFASPLPERMPSGSHVGPGYLLRGDLAFNKQYESWASAGSLGKKVGAFVQGAANFVAAIGVPMSVAIALIAVMVASFAATTLDTACRLQRYVIQEFSRAFLPSVATRACGGCGYDLSGHTEEDICPECGANASETSARLVQASARRASASVFNPFRWLSTTHGATMFAVVTAAGLALAPRPGVPWNGATAGTGGLILWPLFGATNQLLAGFAFVVIASWLALMRKPRWFVVVPGVFMLFVPAAAMIWQGFIGNGSNPSWVSSSNWLLVVIAGVTLVLEAWLLVEVFVHWRSKGGARGALGLEDGS